MGNPNVQIVLGAEPGEDLNPRNISRIYLPPRLWPRFTEWGWWYLEPEFMNLWHFDCSHIGINPPIDAAVSAYCVGVFPKYRSGFWATPAFCGCARCEMISATSGRNKLDIAGLHYGSNVLQILEDLTTQGNRYSRNVFYQVMLLPSQDALTWWRRLDRQHQRYPNAFPSIHFWTNSRRTVFRVDWLY